jgi:comEA protein
MVRRLHGEKRKEVQMNNLRFKALAVGIVFALVFSFLHPLQVWTAQKSGEKKININTASAIELQKLPRIGAKVALRIIDFREKHGKFKRVEDLMKVKGIGEKTFMNLKDLITVGSGEK